MEFQILQNVAGLNCNGRIRAQDFLYFSREFTQYTVIPWCYRSFSCDFNRTVILPGASPTILNGPKEYSKRFGLVYIDYLRNEES
jgi:hypothetical protein